MKNIKLYKKIILGFILLIIFGSGIVSVSRTISAMELIENPIVLHFVTTWRSLRKIVDLPYVIYNFKKSDIPRYHIAIDRRKIKELNLSLPQDNYIQRGDLADEYKEKVKVGFIYKDYNDEVKMRYRGLVSHHWNAKKKSILVEFPEDNLFQGNRVLDFIIPEDRGYLVEALNLYRANKFNLLSPQVKLVNLGINGEDYGAYLENEHWSEEFLEKHERADNGQIYSTKDFLDKVDFSFLKMESLSLWKARIDRPELSNEDFNDMTLLFSLIENSDEEVFAKNIENIFDLEKFYDWMLLISLASSRHQCNWGNMNFYFDPIVGKLELMPRDLGIGLMGDVFDLTNNDFVSRLMNNAKIRENVEKRVLEYVSDPANLEDDLRFYDELWGKTKRDFFADNAKFQSSSYVGEAVEQYRSWTINNFQVLRDQLLKTGKINMEVTIEKGSYPTLEQRGSFATFDQISESVDEFIAQHPLFTKINNQEVRLRSGAYYFNKTIIIPKDVKLTIEPGVNLYLGNATSIVSYGPVKAIGSTARPIKVEAIKDGDKWGTFAVVGAKKSRSEFDNTFFSDGSGAIIHGIKFTGMLALHDSDVNILNSRFENAGDDDALNIKKANFTVKNSQFTNNAFDALDIDFSEGEVTDSVFVSSEDIDSDAIDLSFSKVLIKGNSIDQFGDKGISVGERSLPTIEDNIITNCQIGIAVKDESYADIKNSTLSENATGVSLYRKKQVFSVGGEAKLTNVIFENNDQDVELDNLSEIFYE
jgi:parallel beta-helix repeat protein